jgi:hypothetical protein
MIDPTVRQLLEQAVDSAIKLQLLLMFHENPRLELSSKQVANRIYRDIWSTREALQELCQDDILVARGSAEDPIYGYHPRDDHRDPIARLVSSYNHPIERDHVQHTLREISSDASYRRARTQIRGAFELQSI